jgi:hypothetical protein
MVEAVEATVEVAGGTVEEAGGSTTRAALVEEAAVGAKAQEQERQQGLGQPR